MNNILIIDDHPIIAFSLEAIIKQNFPSFKIFCALNKNSINEAIIAQNYKLIILDYIIPDFNTISFINEMKSKHPETKILIFTSMSEDIYGLSLVKLGINGFLCKSTEKNSIVNAIQQVLNHQTYLSNVLIDILRSQYSMNGHKIGIENLTKRELEIMEILLNGKSSGEIALLLNLKPSTVTSFKKNIYEKLQVSNNIELYKKIKNHEAKYPPI